MGYILVSLGIGFFIGYKKFLSDKMILINGRLQNIWLMLLIFSMGMSIGSDRDILKMLPTIGFKALIFAVMACIGSIVVVYFISKLFKEGDEDDL